MTSSSRLVSVQMPPRLEMLLDMPPVGREIQIAHAWNQEDRSFNIFIKDEDELTFHRHPVAQSTDGIRSRFAYERGLHVFEINWPIRQRGTHAVVGVSTSAAPVHSVGYQSLVGNNEHSWGWDLGRSMLLHNAKNSPPNDMPSKSYPPTLSAGETFTVPETFLAVLDMDEGTLGFMLDEVYLGPAFTSLRGKKLHVMISAVWGHCEIRMKYIGGMEPQPLPLMALCRRRIRLKITKRGIQNGRISELNLPQAIKDYLNYKHQECVCPKAGEELKLNNNTQMDSQAMT
uniref:SPRY domain-containing SOCS box protein 1 n=1 Tax=Caligus rogercresseyi TaxID=217165 RepID=C1BQZ8_CALRO|nr:SPRY domain-containing SOCS box protein 1 [Caligus rogercresseyi]